jgi:hypothetical protein
MPENLCQKILADSINQKKEEKDNLNKGIDGAKINLGLLNTKVGSVALAVTISV